MSAFPDNKGLFVFTHPFDDSKNPVGFTFMVLVSYDKVEFEGIYRPRSSPLTRKVWARKLTGGGPLPEFAGPVNISRVPELTDFHRAKDNIDLKALGIVKGDLIQFVVQHYAETPTHQALVEDSNEVLVRLIVTMEDVR